jgi:hypothetical protein
MEVQAFLWVNVYWLWEKMEGFGWSTSRDP